MSELYLDVNREFIPLVSTLSNSAVAVYLVLLDRAKGQVDLKVGLSLAELARRANLSSNAAKSALDELISSDVISYEKKTKHDIILLNVIFIAEALNPIPFTQKNTDENKIVTVERELAALQRRMTERRTQEKTNIAVTLEGEEREVIGQIEHDLGRAMTHTEAYYLGKLMSAFGPPRVSEVWKSSAKQAKTPLKALSAMLWNGARGKAAKQRETITEEINYL